MPEPDGKQPGPLPRYLIVRNFLSDIQAAELLTFSLQKERSFESTTVDHSGYEHENRAHRSSRKLRGAWDEWKEPLREHLAQAFPSACAGVGVREIPYSWIELELVAHNDGDRFGRHIDTLRHDGAGTEKSARFLSGVYYFFKEPRAFSGGELRIHPFGTAGRSGSCHDIIPEHNSVVFFPAIASHEVLPVHCPTRAFADSRFSINCWFHRALA
jgi:SM-20-related protein